MIFDRAVSDKLMKVRKIQNILYYVRVFLFLLILPIVIFAVYNIDSNSNNISISKDSDQINSVNGPSCDNLSFQKTAICLNDYVRDIFIYNLTEDNIDLSLGQLVSRGGDCLDYTKFYEEYMNYYGYENTQRVKIFSSREKVDGKRVDYYHVFLTAGHSSGYCNMDMKTLECYRYENDRGEFKE